MYFKGLGLFNSGSIIFHDSHNTRNSYGFQMVKNMTSFLFHFRKKALQDKVLGQSIGFIGVCQSAKTSILYSC